MSFGNGPRIVTNGLVLSLDAADQNSYVSGSATWNDLSGNNNTGSFLVTGSNAVSASYNSSNNGNIVFNTGSYVDCGNPTTLTSVNNVSVNVWFKIAIAPTATFQGIIAKRNGSAGVTTNYGINFNNSIFQSYYSVTTFRTCAVGFSTYFTAGTWYNVCATFAANGANTDAVLYRNGVAIATSGSLVGNVTSSIANLTIGNDSANEPFSGSVANVQIYNRTLSATEILQNYNALKSRFNLT